MRGFLLWLTIFPYLLIPTVFAAVLYANHRRGQALRRERDTLLQEKEAALGFVHNVGEVFADAETVETNALLDRVLRYAARTCKASSGMIHLFDPSSGTLNARAVSGVCPPLFEIDPTALDAAPTEALEALIKGRPIPLGKGLVGEAAVLGNSILVEDAEMDSRVPRHPVEFLKIRTLMIAPMRFGNHTIGVMTLVNRVNGDHFARPDLQLAQALAAQASVPIHYAGLQETLEEKRELDRGMRIAKQVQHSLLPAETPLFPSVELSAFNRPAMDIGGDYYDFIQIDEKHIGLVIADVSGKGIGGALMMAVCRSVLRANAERVYDPSSMLGSLNRILRDNLAEDMFITMLYLVLNTETHQLSYARAGHDAPILVRGDDPTADRTETAGIAIGLVDDDTFNAVIETRNISLRSGDLLLTYTDGVTEAMNAQGEEWGVENLTRSVERMAGASAGDLLHTLEREVSTFTGEARQSDDITMLALKIK